MKTVLRRPLSDSLGFSKRAHVDTPAGVVVLGWPVCPNTVVFGIPEIIVNAFNRVFSDWSAPHIRNKRLERFPRSVVPDTSASISCVPFVVWVVAARLHTIPRFVFRRFMPIVGWPPSFNAPTRFSSRESEPANRGYSSAFALTHPHGVSLFVGLPPTYYYQHAITLPKSVRNTANNYAPAGLSIPKRKSPYNGCVPACAGAQPQAVARFIATGSINNGKFPVMLSYPVLNHVRISYWGINWSISNVGA